LEDIIGNVVKLFEQPVVATSFRAIVVLLATLVLVKLLGRLNKHLTKKGAIEDVILRPVLRVVRFLVVACGGVLLLSVLGIGLDGIWTFATTVIALVAVGFIAVWSVLSNFVCTFLIIALKPFQLGDMVSFPGEETSGRVVDLSFGYTTLAGDSGKSYRVPNNLFFQKIIARTSFGEPTRSLAEQLRSHEPYKPV